LREIEVPVLGIYGRVDRIVDPDQGVVLARGIPTADIRNFQRSGHFPMADEPVQFYEALHEFLDYRSDRGEGSQSSVSMASADTPS
jgi:pimeloyl-ACP methyl ester carboxylesterase